MRSHDAGTAMGIGTSSRLSLIAVLREHAATHGLCITAASSCQVQCLAHHRRALMTMTGGVHASIVRHGALG